MFEFDCPAGLAFDARYEVCVWPGSLPHAAACPGSAEIAPVPAARFQCPSQEGRAFYLTAVAITALPIINNLFANITNY